MKRPNHSTFPTQRLHVAAPIALLILLAAGGSLFLRLAAAPPSEAEIAGYATSLQGRTASQRYNAKLAARMIDGKIVAPGAIFSFNRVVKSWSLDQGYVKAPVSFDGELVRAYGGGVCQTSTTLYNAALLANLPIVERHSHVFAAHYAPPGRDAAVAQRTIDLRFKNPYPWPLRIQASAAGDRLDIRLFGAERPRGEVQITTDILSSTPPARLTRVVANSHNSHVAQGRVYVRNPGATGYRVVTSRIVSVAGREIERERLSDDTYQAMNRIVQLNEDE